MGHDGLTIFQEVEPELTSGEGRYRLVSSAVAFFPPPFFQYNPILTNPPADLPPKLSVANNIVVYFSQWAVIIEFIVGVYQTPGPHCWWHTRMDGWVEGVR